MCDNDIMENDELRGYSEALLIPRAPNIDVSHPGITKSTLVAHFNDDKLPSNFRDPINRLADSNDISSEMVKLWNEVYKFVPATFDDLVAQFRLCCGLALLPNNIETTHLKLAVIHKVFIQTSRDWDVSPIRIHVISKELDPLLTDDRNLMYFIRIVAPVSRMAFYVSCCLAWSLFYRSADKEVKMFRFHHFQTMLDSLRDLDLHMMQENSSKFYSLLDAVVFLTKVIVLRKSEEMICETYSNYFACTRDEITGMIHWAEKVQKTYQWNNVENSVNSLLITELLEFEIIDRLRNFLKDSESSIA